MREETLDLLFFARRGLEQVEPDRLAGNRGAGAQFEARQALGLRNEGAQHVECVREQAR